MDLSGDSLRPIPDVLPLCWWVRIHAYFEGQVDILDKWSDCIDRYPRTGDYFLHATRAWLSAAESAAEFKQ